MVQKRITTSFIHLLFCLVAGLTSLAAQTVPVSGFVFADGEREGLIGVNIIIKGTGTGTTTDFDGTFKLDIKKANLPAILEFSYTGYDNQEVAITEAQSDLRIKLESAALMAETVVVKGQRIDEKKKSAALTIESLDPIAIKQTASENFYDGLGALKGVDLTSASLGIKVVNTRGFNSTAPVRILQTIDGVDNASPSINFALGNFLGSSELDLRNVDLIVGASSAFYGPNAFNGVIKMTSKDPYFSKGLSAFVKAGDDSSKVPETHYAGYDAVNIHGDEYDAVFDLNKVAPWSTRGMTSFYRNGYKESELLDYETENFKANMSLNFRLQPEKGADSPELVFANNFSQGSTIFQGSARFRLIDVRYFTSRLELKKRNKYFLRAYMTNPFTILKEEILFLTIKSCRIRLPVGISRQRI